MSITEKILCTILVILGINFLTSYICVIICQSMVMWIYFIVSAVLVVLLILILGLIEIWEA